MYTLLSDEHKIKLSLFIIYITDIAYCYFLRKKTAIFVCTEGFVRDLGAIRVILQLRR